MASKLNAFASSYLSELQTKDEPPTTLEAETSGPKKLAESAGWFHLFRLWESPTEGDSPLVTLEKREVALLFQAIWAAVGREHIFRLSEEAGPEGYAIESGGEVVGHLRTYNPEVVFAAHVAACMVRSPDDLAALLEAAGPTTQELVGEILGRSVLQAS